MSEIRQQLIAQLTAYDDAELDIAEYGAYYIKTEDELKARLRERIGKE